MEKKKFSLLLTALLALALFFAACPETPPDDGNKTEGNSASPLISAHPTSADYVAGDPIGALTVSASASDGGTITYQWYENTAFSNTGGAAISGAKDAAYAPLITTRLSPIRQQAKTPRRKPATRRGSGSLTPPPRPQRLPLLLARQTGSTSGASGGCPTLSESATPPGIWNSRT